MPLRPPEYVWIEARELERLLESGELDPRKCFEWVLHKQPPDYEPVMVAKVPTRVFSDAGSTSSTPRRS
jgi:hypothetical protein